MENLEEIAKKFVRDESGNEGIDIGGLVVLMVSVMVGAIILGALLPTFTSQLGTMPTKTASGEYIVGTGSGLVGVMPDLGGVISLIPMLIVLIFVVSILFVLIKKIKEGMP